VWRSKKFIIIAVLAVIVVLVGSTAGIVLARAGSGGDSQTGVTQASDNVSQSKTLLARVAAILGIDQQTVENAFAQAQRETQEEALDNWLKKLVDEGKITQAQADEYKQWWQSRPDMSQYQQQLKDWQEARPNIPELGPGFGGRGFRGGMDWGGGRGF
jgi:hypothetical protein